ESSPDRRPSAAHRPAAAPPADRRARRRPGRADPGPGPARGAAAPGTAAPHGRDTGRGTTRCRLARDGRHRAGRPAAAVPDRGRARRAVGARARTARHAARGGRPPGAGRLARVGRYGARDRAGRCGHRGGDRARHGPGRPGPGRPGRGSGAGQRDGRVPLRRPARPGRRRARHRPCTPLDPTGNEDTM
ncbi:MAG: hypothetical protein AVDCRST_MAG41-591, partial [uncultured Corynebacteriales bacterium]